MTSGPRIRGPGGVSSISGERGKEGVLFCAVWSCRTDSIKSSHLATSTGLSHRSITFRSVELLLQFKMWFSWGSIQFSVVLIGYVQFVAAFLHLLPLDEVCQVACCLCSTEYGPCVGGYF